MPYSQQLVQRQLWREYWVLVRRHKSWLRENGFVTRMTKRYGWLHELPRWGCVRVRFHYGLYNTVEERPAPGNAFALLEFTMKGGFNSRQGVVARVAVHRDNWGLLLFKTMDKILARLGTPGNLNLWTSGVVRMHCTNGRLVFAGELS